MIRVLLEVSSFDKIGMKKVVIIQRIVPHYRLKIFDYLSKEYDLRVLSTNFMNSVSKEVYNRDYINNVGYLKYSKNEYSFILNTFYPVLKFKPDVVIHEFSLGIISLIPTFIMSKIFGIKFILWGHSFNLKKGFHPSSSFKDFLRLKLIKFVDQTILYGENQANEISKHLKDPKLTVANNTLDTNYLKNLRISLEKKGIEKIKNEISFDKKINLIFIGRILKDKKPEICLKILKDYIEKYDNDILLHFVGDGDYLSTLTSICIKEGLNNNVKFHGRAHDSEITSKLLFCSDLMIMPGYLGLSIIHSFCFDCPVVSFAQTKNGPFHSPEVSNIKQGKTGFLANDYNEMKDFVFRYLDKSIDQDYFKENIRHCIDNDASLDKMIEGFRKCI